MKLADADGVYIGATPVDAVYVGAKKVWPKSFDPSSLGGLVVWLDASQLGLADGAYVDPWPSLVNPALNGANYNTVPNQPKMRVNGLNGLPVVRFTQNSGLRWPNTGCDLQWTVIYVGRMWASSIGRVVSGGYPPSNIVWGFWNGFEDVVYVEGFLTPDTKKPQTNNWKLYSGWGDGGPGNAATAFYSNGAYLAGGQPGSQNGGGWKGTFQINGYSPADNQETCECEIAEVLIYNRRLTDTDRADVENYLRVKWGL